jgi:hypothetical protein
MRQSSRKRRSEMNEKTAARLNYLLNMTALVSFDAATCKIIVDLNCWNYDAKSIPSTLEPRINQIIVAHYPAAMAQEISAAAAERRIAHCFNPMESSTHKDSAISWWLPNRNNAGRIAVDMANPEINALIEADNARRKAEYERYRIACEQGVAVPPQD